MSACRCNFPFLFPEYHWPHCPDNPANLNRSERKHMETLFTKAELAHLSTHGPVRDQPVRRKNAKKVTR